MLPYRESVEDKKRGTYVLTRNENIVAKFCEGHERSAIALAGAVGSQLVRLDACQSTGSQLAPRTLVFPFGFLAFLTQLAVLLHLHLLLHRRRPHLSFPINTQQTLNSKRPSALKLICSSIAY